MKKYFRGWVTLPLDNYVPAITEKAVCFTIAGGVTCANDVHVWFPKSQIIIGNPNEYGNAEILIPYWLIRSKSNNNALDFFRRIREIEQYNAVSEIVKR